MNIVTQVSTATSGTVTCSDTKQDVVLFHDATAVTLTITLPANPIEGQRVCMTTSGGITTLTMTAAVGTIVSALTTLALGVPKAVMYSAAQVKWFPVT